MRSLKIPTLLLTTWLLVTGSLTHAAIESGGATFEVFPSDVNLKYLRDKQSLVVRITGVNSRPDTNWATALQWNVVIPPQNTPGGAVNPLARTCTSSSDSECYDGVDANGANVYRLNVTAVSQIDYSRLAVQAGLPGGISFDRGIILGEAHDCDGVRLTNAEVAMAPVSDRFSYFTAQF